MFVQIEFGIAVFKQKERCGKERRKQGAKKQLSFVESVGENSGVCG